MSESSNLLFKDFLDNLDKANTYKVYHILSLLCTEKESFHTLINYLPLPIQEDALSDVLHSFFLGYLITDNKDIELYKKYQHLITPTTQMKIKVFNQGNPNTLGVFEEKYDTPAQMYKEIMFIRAKMYSAGVHSNPSYSRIISILENNKPLIEKSIKTNSKSYYNLIKNVVSLSGLTGSDALNILTKLGCDNFSANDWNKCLDFADLFSLRDSFFKVGYSDLYPYFKDVINNGIWDKNFVKSIGTSVMYNIAHGGGMESVLEMIEYMLENGTSILKEELEKIGFSLENKKLSPMNDTEFKLLKEKIYTAEYYKGEIKYNKRNEDVLLYLMIKEDYPYNPPKKTVEYHVEGVNKMLSTYHSYIEKKHLSLSFDNSVSRVSKTTMRV